MYKTLNNTEYLDDEYREERPIEYLVKDEVGALASTLAVISVSSFLINGYSELILILADLKGNGHQCLWCKS